MVSRLVVVPSDGLSSPIAVAKAERGQSMKNNVNPSEVTLNYAHPYFVPIEDGDETTIKFYKSHDVPVAHIALPGRMKHYYAIFDASTQEEADMMNRAYNKWERKDSRDEAERKAYETSYNELLDGGYDASSDDNNPEEIAAYGVVIDALHTALKELTSEKLRACQMVANDESQRFVAEELNIPRRTLRDRKDSALKELGEKLKDYK